MLLLMGADMLRSAATVGAALRAAEAAPNLAALSLAGAGASLANPYFAVWWATVGAGQIATVGPRSPAAWVTFYLGHVSSDFLWYAIVAFAIGSGRRVLGATGHQALIIVCAVALLGLGCYFLYAGIRRFRPSGGAPASAASTP
jgi:threonine/homoserine/homoserine lactone efflux protein